MRSVYENVELIRRSRGITKSKMAKEAQISNMNCVRYLKGQLRMPAEILRPFAASLYISDINIFFDDKLTDSVIVSDLVNDFKRNPTLTG